MKTTNILSGSKNLVAVVLLVLSTSSIYAQYPSDNAILAFNNGNKANKHFKTSKYIETNSLMQYTVDENCKDIHNWIDKEMSKAVDKAHLDECMVSTSVTIELNKQGEVANYNIEDNNNEICYLLDNVLKNAPTFRPITMNGYASKMLYKIPVTIEIK